MARDFVEGVTNARSRESVLRRFSKSVLSVSNVRVDGRFARLAITLTGAGARGSPCRFTVPKTVGC